MEGMPLGDRMQAQNSLISFSSQTHDDETSPKSNGLDPDRAIALLEEIRKRHNDRKAVRAFRERRDSRLDSLMHSEEQKFIENSEVVLKYLERRDARLNARFDYGIPGMKWGQHKAQDKEGSGNGGKTTLSEDERGSLLRYKSSESYKINHKLRNGGYESLSEEDKSFVDNIDSALEKLPKYDGELYRTLFFLSGADMKQFLSTHEPGDIVEYPAYTSFSKTNDYNDAAQVFIHISNSSNGRDMESVDNGENEVLYGRNSKFVVKSKTTKDGAVLIELEESV